MEWNETIKECPSNINGKCVISPENDPCENHISEGKCPIKQLESKTKSNNKRNTKKKIRK